MSPEVEGNFYRQVWQEKLQREAGNLSADGEPRASAAMSFIKKGRRLLDVGCGEGSFAARVCEQFDEVHGVDISEEAVRLAKQNGVRAVQCNLNVEPLPFPDSYFDVVVTLDVIEHVFDPVRFLQEIRRVLIVGGSMILSTPNIRKIQRIVSLIRGRFPRTSFDPVGFDGGHLHYFTTRDMRELLEECGFRVNSVCGICTDRRSWKYRLAVGILGKDFEEEFLSNAFVVEAVKR